MMIKMLQQMIQQFDSLLEKNKIPVNKHIFLKND